MVLESRNEKTQSGRDPKDNMAVIWEDRHGDRRGKQSHGLQVKNAGKDSGFDEEHHPADNSQQRRKREGLKLHPPLEWR